MKNIVEGKFVHEWDTGVMSMKLYDSIFGNLGKISPGLDYMYNCQNYERKILKKQNKIKQTEKFHSAKVSEMF